MSDTTATTIRSTLLYVFTHPPVYAKLQAEVDATVEAGQAPPVPGIISDVEAKSLPYLQAVIKEGMRIHVAYAVHLDKNVYGQDCGEFRPERWLLVKDEAKLAVMHKTHKLIFGYGRYQCLGKPIALTEIGKTVFEVSPHGIFLLSLSRD